MTQAECINCGAFHRVDSIDGQPGDTHAKVTYTCPENGVRYGSNQLVKNLKDVTQQGGEFTV